VPAELAFEKLVGGFESRHDLGGAGDAGSPDNSGIGLLPIASRCAFGQSDPGPPGQVLNRLGEAAPAREHDEADRISAGMTAEAEEEPALGVDAERGGVLLVEGAEPIEPRSSPLEGRVLRHQSGEVGLAPDRVESSRVDGHGSNRSEADSILSHPADPTEPARGRGSPVAGANGMLLGQVALGMSDRPLGSISAA